MSDPDEALRKAGDAGSNPADALLNLLEFSERWVRQHLAETRAETERLTVGLSDLAAALAQQEAALAQAQAERDELRRVLAHQESIDPRLQASLAEADRLRSALDREQQTRARLEDALAAGHRAFAEKDAEVRRLRKSLSWRMTKPLRNLRRLMRGVSGRDAPDSPG